VRGDMIHVFGPGHAHILAEEIGRAGGIPAFNQLLDPDLMPFMGPQNFMMENLEGYGVIIFESYETKPGEAVIICSVAGLAAVAIDVALAAKRRGLTVIGIGGLDYSKSGKSFHSSGKRLFEASDYFIDTFAPVGEAAVALEGMPMKVSPTTTITSAAVLNALQAMIAGKMLDRGMMPPVTGSANVAMDAETREKIAKLQKAFREKHGRRRRPQESLKEILSVSKGYTAKTW